ncbi:MAG: hypothetical protein EHM58_17665 [Ignavibacteriae bacterium]|nr:MAG: hypothetical protein EHM58_17665 [Ignavibacteriota bacterium]
MKIIIYSVFFLLCFIASTNGQLKEHDNLMGGTLGFWTRNSSPTFGLNYENQITQAGIVTIGLGALLRYSNYPNNFERFSNTFIGGQVNFNFNQIESGKFVPFAGLVLGFYSSSPNGSSLKESGLWTYGQAGMRYFFSPSVAGVARVGLGNFNFNSLELGADIKF